MRSGRTVSSEIGRLEDERGLHSGASFFSIAAVGFREALVPPRPSSRMRTAIISSLPVVVLGFSLSACGSEVVVLGSTSGGSGGSGAGASTGQVTGQGTSTATGSSGLCGVTTLASGLSHPAKISYYGDSVYVTAEDPSHPAPSGISYFGTPRILRVPIAGGAATEIWYGSYAWGLSANATGVYSTHFDGSVRRISLSGGDEKVIATGESFATGIVADEGHVYWMSEKDVKSAPIDGGPATALFTDDGVVYPGFDVDVDADAICFTAFAHDSSSVGQIVRAPLAGGAPTVLVGSLWIPEALHVGNGKLYFTDLATPSIDTGQIFSHSLAGTEAPVLLASGQTWARGVAESLGNVYWAGGLGPPPMGGDSYPGPVTRVGASSSTPQIVSPGTIAGGIVACSGGICWTDEEAGTVMRFAECVP